MTADLFQVWVHQFSWNQFRNNRTFNITFEVTVLSPNCVQKALKSTHLLTPWCRVLPEQLTGLQLVKKFPAFHGTRRFITALTRVRHLSLSWAICAMLPLETLPPGEPNGGVVYLRIVLSPEQASHLWMFLNNVFLQGGVVSTSPNP